MIPIKINCSCGQRYSFDVDAAASHIPSPVVCPVCGADGTAAANTALSQALASPGRPKLSVATRASAPSSALSEPIANNLASSAAAQSLPGAAGHKRGRLILLAALCPLLFCQLLVVGFVLANQLGSPGKHIARALLHSAFMVGTYFGHTWSRRLLLLVSVLGVLDASGDLLTGPNWVSAFVLLTVAPIPAVLLFSKSVNEFFDFQGRER